MKKVFIPLFWQFTISIVLIVTLFASVNILITKHFINIYLSRELEKRGLYISKSIADQVTPHILYENIVSLYKIIEKVKSIDPSVAYVFILNVENKVVAHNFDTSVPPGLIKANQIQDGSGESTVLIRPEHNNNILIRDIAVPVLDGKIGTVRVGLYEESLQKNISRVIRILVIMVVIFLLAGILAAFIFSFIITKPIKYISKIAESIDIESLKYSNQNTINLQDTFFYKLKGYIYTTDEIDILVAKFNEMLDRLDNTYSELQSTQNLLLHSEKMASIGTLSAGIAHEINNPIAGLQNCVHRISRDPTNFEQNKKYLDMMKEAINTIEKVVNELLKFSRKYDLDFVEVDIRTVIENSLSLSSHRLNDFQIEIKKEYPQTVPLINGSINHLEQVLINLILNSIDAIAERQIKKQDLEGKIVFVILVKGSRLILKIKDNGIGILPDEINKIFDPFYTTKGIGKGTGLGLSVCYNIIREHDGEIHVESNPEESTIFTIILPLQKQLYQ